MSTPETGLPPADVPASLRTVTAGQGWSLGEFRCDAGPDDPAFEERHEAVTIAAVLEGSFTYHGEAGRSLMHPGALLLGNPGACYQCSHAQGRGDICRSLRIAPDLFSEVASSFAGSARYRFPVSMAPADRANLPCLAQFAAIGRTRQPLARDEAFLRLVSSLLGHLSGHRPEPVTVSPRDEIRIGRVVRHMERRAAEPLDLDGLAGLAGMSKFHFLRAFRRSVGVTPHRYLVHLRIGRAAQELAGSRHPVTAIAYDAGFGDLSSFNATFHTIFGTSPGAFRRRHAKP